MGKLGEATIFASESVALDVIGASFVRDVEPGELILVNDKGLRSFRPLEKAEDHDRRAELAGATARRQSGL